MKGTKLILFLLVLLTPYVSSAIDVPICGVNDINKNCSIEKNKCDGLDVAGEQACNSTTGCVWTNGNSKCEPCTAGTYDYAEGNATYNSSFAAYKEEHYACKNCINIYNERTGIATGWKAEYNKSYCPYTVRCSAGQYYNGTECTACPDRNIAPEGALTYTYIPDQTTTILKCYECGDNSLANSAQTECKCNPYYQYNGSSSVTYCPDGICPPCTYKPTNITYTCTGDTETTYDDVATSEDYYINVNFSNNCSKTGHTLAGWQCTSCSDNQTIYKPGSSFYNPAEKTGTQGNINFTSRFEAKTFTITFKSSTSSDATNCFDPSSFNCTYDGDCTNTKSENLSSLLYKSVDCAAPTETPIFDGWECYKTNADGTTTPCSTDDNHITYDEIAGIIDVNYGTVKEGKNTDFKNIINLSGGDNAIFVPKFKKCTNGKYCFSSGGEYDCPAPSTSDYNDTNYIQKYNISDCYITKDTTFCPNNKSDNSQCFKLETLGATKDTKIHHVAPAN